MSKTEISVKHTPGPWQVNCSHIYAPDGAIIAQVHNPGSKASDYPLVANRDLMAGAPELLAALQEYMACVALTTRPEMQKADVLTLHEVAQRLDAARVQAEAAIAAATGQSVK